MLVDRIDAALSGPGWRANHSAITKRRTAVMPSTMRATRMISKRV
jgi:hypothetical protein